MIRPTDTPRNRLGTKQSKVPATLSKQDRKRDIARLYQPRIWL